MAVAMAESSQSSDAHWWNSVATRDGSAHCRNGSTTMIRAPARAASVTKVASARESQGAPSSTMLSGSGGSVRTMASAAAIVPSNLLPDRGSASTGQPSRSASSPTRAGSARCGQGPPAMMSPGPCRGSSSVVRGPARPAPVDHHLRTLARRERRCRAGEGLSELEIEMHRARTVGSVHRLLEGPDGQWPPGVLLALGRHARREGPAGRGGEQPVLFNGLGGTGVVQLGRPVRRADDERNPGVVRLDDRRMELGGGGAARHADDGRPPRRHRQPRARRMPRCARRGGRGPAVDRPRAGPAASSAIRRRRRHR